MRKMSFLLLFLLNFNAFANFPEHTPGEVLVTYKNINSQYKVENDLSFKITSSRTIKGIETSRIDVLSFDQYYSLKEVIKEIEKSPHVDFAEPNYIYRVGNHLFHQEFHSIESMFSLLWGLKNQGNNEPDKDGNLSSKKGISGADINALKAWNLTKGSRRIKIAVIDTGVDYKHNDLKANIWVNEKEKYGSPYVDDDGNGYIDDIHGYDFANNDGDPLDGHGHGTHCAGTIAAVHGNGIGVAGVMAYASIVPIKFLTDSGSGTTEAAIKSIAYATKLNVDIMSNSWGGGAYSRNLEQAIKNARDQGIIFVAAAGNSSKNNDRTDMYPANYKVSNVISVAAHNAQNALASFSNHGKNSVHIAAPGKNILSTVINNKYAVYSGTSMATPHVAGALGLLLSKTGRMDHEILKERLIKTVSPIPNLRSKVISKGRLNAYNLLINRREKTTEPDPLKWKRVVLSEPFESSHPYELNQNFSKTFYAPSSAKFMRVFVEKADIEKIYDYLMVTDQNKNQEVDKIYGIKENYLSEYVHGNIMNLIFKSDRMIYKWGFKVTAYEYQ